MVASSVFHRCWTVLPDRCVCAIVVSAQSYAEMFMKRGPGFKAAAVGITVGRDIPVPEPKPHAPVSVYASHGTPIATLRRPRRRAGRGMLWA